MNCGLDCGSQTEELLFQTGFNTTNLENGEYNNVYFSGIDTALSEKNDWEEFTNNDHIGFVEIGYEDGDDSQRKASITSDPDDPTNNVLHYQIFEPHIKEGSKHKGRIQLSVHDNKCIKELYQSVRLKLHPDIGHLKTWEDEMAWFTLFEFWNNGAWTGEKNTFRVSVNLYKATGNEEEIYFRVKSDYKKCKTCEWKEVWGETATHFPVSFGEWMTINLYLKEGDESNGRFFMEVTPETGTMPIALFNITNFTQHPKEKCADGFTHFETMKMYTSEEVINDMKANNKSLSIYWDDWSLYLNKMP